MTRRDRVSAGLNSWSGWSDHHVMRRIRGGAAALVITLAIGLASANGAGAASVSPSTFTATVCAAIADGAKTATPAATTLQSASAAYKASPTSTTAAALRDALTQVLQSVEQQITGALTAVQQSGTPAGGARFVAALKTALEQGQALGRQLAQRSAAIDVSSPATFSAGVRQVESALKDGSARLKKLVKANSAFKHAPKAYHPLVVYMTTNADTCPAR